MTKEINEMNTQTDDFGNWFAGFTAGEGCFGIGKRNKENPCANYQCLFRITLRDDDRAILEEIQDTLGLGKVYDYPACTNDAHERLPQTLWDVRSTTECAELVEVFEKYPLRAKKQRDFEIWKKAVAELQKPVDCRDPDLLEYYFHRIKEVRQYEPQDELAKPQIKSLQLTIEFH